jgi:thiol:disulfide interchange protein DsbD
VFVLGIAATFTTLGIVAALSGTVFGTALSSPWVLGGVALLFIALSLSMFGLFNMNLPSSWQSKLSELGGSGYGGAFVLGLVCGIIASPCTGPVLTGILIWVSQTQNVAFGAAALFAFAVGLGALFFVLGTFAASLPKSGAWMEHVKSIFGIAFLVVGAYYLQFVFRSLDDPFRSGAVWVGGGALVAALGLALGAVHLDYHAATTLQKVRKTIGIALAVVGAFGAISSLRKADEGFHWVESERDGIRTASAESRPVILDFTADWCGACQELAHRTFSDPRVKEEATRFVAIRVDSTQMDDAVTALHEKYHVRGLPTVILLGSNGHESSRVTEFMEAERFLPLLEQAAD